MIKKISDMHNKIRHPEGSNQQLDAAVTFITQVKLLAPPKVTKPAVRIYSFGTFDLKVHLVETVPEEN